MTQAYQFLSAVVMMGCWVAGVFFLRFWHETKDRLFLFFAASFWFMALERIVLAFMGNQTSEDHSSVFLIRLVSFCLILFAIFDKNRNERKK